MANNLLTIAIPTYNRLSKLQNCLKRIILELPADNSVEVLVSDNASQDGTDEFMKNICKKYPFISYYRNSENLGPDRNFLNCYNRAFGEYIVIIGDDDFLLPGALYHILAALKHQPAFIHLNTCGLITDEPFTYGCSRFEEGDAIFYNDKNEFLKKIGIYITFISSLVCRTDLVKNIENKEQYIGTYFLQSHIALEIMRENGNYMIVNYNCLAASENKIISYDLYYVWFECLYNLLIETGTKCGFNKNVLLKVFYDCLNQTVFGFVLKFRWTCRRDEKNWNREYAYKCLSKFPSVQKQFRRIINCPVWQIKIWKMYYRICKNRKVIGCYS